MLRGVNKQIIEINSTENDFFEKAILFVRPEKTETDAEELHKRATKFLNEVSTGKEPAVLKSRSIMRFLKKKMFIAIALSLIITASVAVILFMTLN